MKKMSLIFSAEFFFAAFLLAGYFKGGIPWFPVDITLFCLFITLVFAVVKLFSNPRFPKQTLISTGLFAVFTIIILMSFLYTESVVYANEKTIRYLVITSWSFLGVYVLIRDTKSLMKFINSIILISFIVSIVGLHSIVTNLLAGTYIGRVFVMDTDYLALGRTVGLGLLLLISLKWFDSQKSTKISNIMILIMAFVLLFSGGRMPLLGMIASLLALMILATKVTSSKKVIINKGVKRLSRFLVLGLIVLIPVYMSGKFNDIFLRISGLFSGEDEASLVRLTLYKTALKMIAENPLIGTGWASFPLYYYGMDYKVYPHNIFLEVFSELGIFGFIILTSILMYAVYYGLIKFKKRYKKFNNIQFSIIGGFLFFLLNANTSGDITDNKILLTFTALLTISTTINNVKEKDSPVLERQKLKHTA